MTASEERQLRYWAAMVASARQLGVRLDNIEGGGFRSFSLSGVARRYISASAGSLEESEMRLVCADAAKPFPRMRTKAEAREVRRHDPVSEPEWRKLGDDEPVCIHDVAYYRGQELFLSVSYHWLGRTRSKWPRGRVPAVIWRKI